MKIVYIADANSIHTRRWVEPFVAQGHEVHLLSYKPVTQGWPGAHLVDLTRLTNVRKMRFAYWGLWARRYVRRLRPDILHTHQLQAAGWMGVMAGYHPFVASAWGSDLLVEPQRSGFRRLLIWRVLACCDGLTVPSPVMRDAARALGVPQDKMRLLPVPLDHHVFRPSPDDRLETRRRLGLDADAPVVLCTRRAATLYNLDVAVEAAALARRRFPDLRLVLLRFNPEPAYLHDLESLICQRGMQEAVRWLPRQESASHMARLYRMADVALSIPSSEGYGLSVFEALACGCPTLITDLPAFAGQLAHQVHTVQVPVRDVPQTAQGLERLLADVELRASLREGGLQVTRQMGADDQIRQLAALYEELISP